MHTYFGSATDMNSESNDPPTHRFLLAALLEPLQQYATAVRINRMMMPKRVCEGINMNPNG